MLRRWSIDIARIRTIKPEAFSSESLAAVSLSAERTFFGLLTQADDHGRFRDQPAVIAGLLWSLRPEHGPMDVEDDLAQLACVDLICRYKGEDGKRYLHAVTFSRHQKINRPSGVRHPACPHHDGARRSESSRASQGGVREDSVSAHGDLAEISHTRRVGGEIPGQSDSSESAVKGQGGLPEPSVSPHRPDLGPRIMDLGSIPTGAASDPAPNTTSAHQLIGEYLAACAHRPPEKFLGHLGREINQLLTERIAPAHIRAALERLRAKGLSPGVLSSLVNEAMNATPAARAAHRPWTNPTDAEANPTDAEAAYGGDL